jgi:hypothetical protein
MEKQTYPGPETNPPNPPFPQAIVENTPEVIVDFVYDEGLFFISVQNISDRPAYKVQVDFEPPFKGLGGSLEASSMPLFRNIEFLAPHKTISTFLDTSTAYFKRGEPTRITARISFRDGKNRPSTLIIQHDLEIYRSIITIHRQVPKSASPAGNQ